jgi:1-acyl-sn-glycerol-3-phosphate acyltransferase
MRHRSPIVEDSVQYRASRWAGLFVLCCGGRRSPAREYPETGGALIASNHMSIVDSVFLPLVISRPVTFAAKSEHPPAPGWRPGDRDACGPLTSCR